MMNSDTEKSFIALLRMFDHKVNLLEVLHGKPALATVSLFSGGFYSGRPQTRDHSNLLGICPNEQIGDVKPLKLHFRHTPDGYVLSIKNTGEYYNHPIGETWLDAFAAVDSDADDPTVFTLVNHQGNPITLDNLSATHTPVSLMTEDKNYMGGLKVKGSPYVYLGRTEERSKIIFILSIIERKVSP